jgi:hypothetical protein
MIERAFWIGVVAGFLGCWPVAYFLGEYLGAMRVHRHLEELAQRAFKGWKP